MSLQPFRTPVSGVHSPMGDDVRGLIENLGSMTLADIRQAVSQFNPPYPPTLLEALQTDARAGAHQVLKQLQSRERAAEAERRRIDRMLTHERQAWADGFTFVAGIDEAGRGPLAGPVVASAVILPPSMPLTGIDDSKALTDSQRRIILPVIARTAEIGIGVVSVEQIDKMDIHKANLLAMRLALEDLGQTPDLILVDGRPVAGLAIPQRAIVGGDRYSVSIAAASIVAKVVRDEMMLEFDRLYPNYNFARHKGYGTAEHIALLRKHGVSPVHRRSFAPVRECLETVSGRAV